LNKEYIDGQDLKKLFIGAANYLDQHKDEVNSLNVFPVPDGDTGTNMSLTLKSAVKQILNLEELSVDKVAAAASNGSLMGARGNSGVILSQLFRGLSNGLKGKKVAYIKDFAESFNMAQETAYKAVMKPTEGTVLTVARECADKAAQLSKDEKYISEFLYKIIEYGNEVLNKTPDMLPVLKQAGVVDAGGKGLLVILQGAYNTLNTDEEIEFRETSTGAKTQSQNMNFHKDIDTNDIKFGYCTEFLVNNTDKNPQVFREELAPLGDSLLVVGGDNFIKVHIHTNNPGIVLEKAVEIGELNDIKIDNMRRQHRRLVVTEEEEKKAEENEKEEENLENDEIRKYGIITVSMGDGISEVFKGLHADYIIPGGQTMNPSTEDILNAVNKIKAENIIIFPNNSNIILAAEQAKELSDKNIYVFPTKTIPQGISALISFNEELSVEENIENMKEAIGEVKTGQITYAVRDTEMNGTKIKKGDIIGISNGGIKATGQDVQEVSERLLNDMVDKDTSIVTIFYGNDTEKEQADELAGKIEKEHNDCDIEVIYGGQPLYYYIFSIE